MARIEIDNAKLTDQGVELKTSSGGKEYASFTVMWSSSRKDRNTGDREFGPTKFLRVMAFGFQAGDIAASIKGGDRVNVAGNVEHHTWESQSGPKDDWSMFAESVTIPVPRSSQGGRQQGGFNNQQQQPQQAQGGFNNDPWGSQPQGGAQQGQEENPPF